MSVLAYAAFLCLAATRLVVVFIVTTNTSGDSGRAFTFGGVFIPAEISVFIIREWQICRRVCLQCLKAMP